MAKRAWYPVPVDIWDPPFNQERLRSQADYVPLRKAAKRWRICVVIPHLKDTYWLAVNYGIIDEAKRLGVAVRIYSAGGYGELAVQRRQIEQAFTEDFDGMILSALSATELNDLIKRWRDSGRPVIDLINTIDSPDLSARTAITNWDTGNLAGSYLDRLTSGRAGPIRVAWFPGPQGAGWSAAADEGLRAVISASSMSLLATRWGDTGREAQTELIEEVLASAEVPDYILGTAVTAEAAVDVLRNRGLSERVGVMAYYYGPGVHRGIRRRQILAAPTDKQAITARIAVDTMVRILENRKHHRHVAPRVQVVDQESVESFDTHTSVAPRGFRAIFSVNY